MISAEEFEILKKQVAEQKKELESLREFVSGLYAMIGGDEQYVQTNEQQYADFRGLNT